MNSSEFLEKLAISVSLGQSLEALTRPLLVLLEDLTGLESTYLTTIDEDAGTQHVLFARNVHTLQIPEDLTVPWHDTLCKRALEEGRPYTDDVSACWGDSDAAQALGIRTYLSAAVYVGERELYGTLCAASSRRQSVDARAQRVLGMFARLIGQQVERERLVAELRAANLRLSGAAFTDALTGLPNRRALLEALERELAQGARTGATVIVCFTDLDDFKSVNDLHGHAVGDAFLTAMGERLRECLPDAACIARYGGDEFVVVEPGPAPGEAADAAGRELAQRVEAATRHRFDCLGVQLDYGGASAGAVVVAPGEGSAEGVLRRADDAMYRAKQARRRRNGHTRRSTDRARG